jgi:PIN domain nuclease of toxin-antitoxin system
MSNFSTVSYNPAQPTAFTSPKSEPKNTAAPVAIFYDKGVPFHIGFEGRRVVIIDPSKPLSSSDRVLLRNDTLGITPQDQRVAVEAFRARTTVQKNDAEGVFNVSAGPTSSAGSVEAQANQIAQGIRLNGGVGEYFAIGVDLPDLLTGTFSQALALALRKLGVPAATIAAAEKFITNLAAKGKSLGGSIGTVPRVEFNFSMLPSAEAQLASSNVHIKFSPASYQNIQALIANYKVIASAIPGGEIMVDLLTQLQQRIDRTGKLKPNTSPVLSAIYASLVAEVTPERPTPAKPGPIPKQTSSYARGTGMGDRKPTTGTVLAKKPVYTAGKWALSDTRFSFNLVNAFSGQDSNSRIGRMYIALGNPERLNESLSRNKLGKFINILGAPYASPRVGANGFVQLVFGFGGLALATDNAPNLKKNKGLLFPGVYVSAKLSFGPNETFVKIDDKTFALRMSINGESVLFVVPLSLFNTVQTMIVGNGRELKLSSIKPGEKVLDVNGVMSEFLIKNIDPNLLEKGSQIAQKTQEIAGILSNQTTQDIGTLLMGIMGFRAGPYVGTFTTATALSEIASNRYERAFENFHEALMKRMSSRSSSAVLYADMKQTLDLLVRAYEANPNGSKGQLRAAIAKVFIFYNKSFEKALTEGKLPGRFLGFYKVLTAVVKNSPAGSFDSLVAQKLLGLPVKTSDSSRTGTDIAVDTMTQLTGKEIFPLFRQIEQMKNSGATSLSDAQVLKMVQTKNPTTVRECIDFYIASGGNAQRLTNQLGWLWANTPLQEKKSTELYDTYCAAISSPVPRAWVAINNAVVSGDVASIRNQNKLYDFGKIEGFLGLKSPRDIANFMQKISAEALNSSLRRDEQIRANNPAYAGQR